MSARKVKQSGDNFIKTKIVFENFKTNPVCPHGPQICFEKGDNRYYNCSAFRSPNECRKNVVQRGIENKQDNKGLAQYLFTNSAIEFFVSTIKELGEKWILCVGAPSIHDSLVTEKGFHSFLLDLDISMVQKHSPKSAHYNMCNHHFFDDDSGYKKFLRKAAKKQGRLVLITDPPFGARPELLAHVHELISNDFNTSRGESEEYLQVKIIWVAPYFLEGHIKKANPTLEMCDYQINYSNHSSFSEGEKRSRKEGSPIRLFTNIPLNLIALPEPLYKFCKECQRYVSCTNRHCKVCKACTSKDGKTYKHCDVCNKCVKPTWFHCYTCESCVLLQDHMCLSKNNTAHNVNIIARSKKRKLSKGKKKTNNY